MSRKPSTLRVALLAVPLFIIAMLDEWLELALGIVMIFGSLVIAALCWHFLGWFWWLIAMPLIAVNIIATGAGIWFVRDPFEAIEKLKSNTSSTHSDGEDQADNL